jgi:ABC-type nickel/cobalt efflux system permease component RcnA
MTLLRALAAICFMGISSMFASSASAHPLDIAYLDFSKNTSTGLTLTVAVHPYQAFELVRAGQNISFDLAKLATGEDLIGAYVADHVEAGTVSGPCRFEPESAFVPSTDLEAVADGVTVSAPLACPESDPQQLYVTSTVFIDGFPQQTSIVRLEFPDGFADRGTLDRTKRGMTLDLTELSSASASASVTETPKNELAALALRAISEDVGMWGFFGILVFAVFIGALHAMGPGHGKALMAASLLGSHATARRAMALAGVITITHVADVVILALIASFVAVVFPAGDVFRALEFISAGALVLLGLATLIRAILRYRLISRNPALGSSDDAHARSHALGLPHHHGHDADHDHGHHHDHEHDHHAESTASFRRALWTGFLGALAPCPAAWAMFMATLASGRPGIGLALLLAFTIGLAGTLVSVGLLIVTSSAFALRRTPVRFTYALPILSSTLITLLGAWLLIRLFV